MRLLTYLLFIGLYLIQGSAFGQSGLQRLQQYQARLKTLGTVAYNVQRIDTFANGDTWNHKGSVLLRRNINSKILQSDFLCIRPDLMRSYYYNDSTGFDINDKNKTFYLENNPYAPSIFGSPAGQLLVDELLFIDSSYQNVTCNDVKLTDCTLHLHYPDQPDIDVSNRNTYITLNKATGLPIEIRTTMQRSGEKWTTIKILSELRINNSKDAESLSNPGFLTTYTQETLVSQISLTSSLKGHIAPSFQLISFAKKIVTLNNYSNQIILLNFWQTTCAPCISSMPKIQELQDRYREKGLIVIGILLDNNAVERASGILQRQRVTYLNLLGNDDVAKAYQVDAFPRYLVINKSNHIDFDQTGGISLEEVTDAIKNALEKK